MARVKLSEYKAKLLLFDVLEQPYSGTPFDAKNSSESLKLDTSKKYVVKVDQGVKKRFKRGLIGVDKIADEVKVEIQRMRDLGFQHFIIEEFVPHDEKEEQYLSIERTRDGYKVLYSAKGGVNIEEDGRVQEFLTHYGEHAILGEGLNSDSSSATQNDNLNLPKDLLQKLLEYFDKYYISFMEINPFIIYNSQFIILDLAVEVDSAAQFFVEGAWTEEDFRFGEHKTKTEEEMNIEELAAKSQASFKFDLLNPNGALWLLLSGGGASIVVADEGYNLGHGKEIANYGEYSGNPNEQETYLYTKNLLSLLLKSRADKKVLIIAGGVANFTDVAKTFKGIIKAIEEVSEKLKGQGVRVYVRRGGPNQIEGLKIMEEFLRKYELYGDVKGPELVLTDIVSEAAR